nr:MAG TPA: hypothetical protein [Caudoviricetes sp.]
MAIFLKKDLTSCIGSSTIKVSKGKQIKKTIDAASSR